MPNTVLNADFIIVWTSDDIGIICMHGNGTLKGWLTLAEVRLKCHVTLVWGKDKKVEVTMKSILSKTKKWVKYDKEGHLYWMHAFQKRILETCGAPGLILIILAGINSYSEAV